MRQLRTRTGLALAFAAAIALWWISSRESVHRLAGHEGGVTAIAVWGDTIATGSQDSTVRLWSVGRGLQLKVLRGHEGAVTAVAFSDGGRQVISGSASGMIRVWEIDSGIEQDAWRAQAGAVLSISIHDSTQQLATVGAGSSIVLMDLNSGRSKSIRSFSNPQLCLFNPAGNSLFFGCGDGKIGRLDLSTMKPIVLPHSHGSKITGFGISDDGTKLVSCGIDRRVLIFDVRSSEYVVKKLDFSLHSLSFTSAGQFIVGDSRGRIHRFDVLAGNVVDRYQTPLATVRSLSANSEVCIAGGLEFTPLEIELEQFVTHRSMQE